MNPMSLPKPILLLCLVLPAGAVSARAGSLWPSESAGMVADHKAAHTGDILTVIVQETASASSTQNKQSTRKSSVNDAVSRPDDAIASAAGSTPRTSHDMIHFAFGS